MGKEAKLARVMDMRWAEDGEYVEGGSGVGMDEERHFIGGLLDGDDHPETTAAPGPGPLGANPTPHFWPEPPPPYSPRPATWAEMRQPGPPPTALSGPRLPPAAYFPPANDPRAPNFPLPHAMPPRKFSPTPYQHQHHGQAPSFYQPKPSHIPPHPQQHAQVQAQQYLHHQQHSAPKLNPNPLASMLPPEPRFPYQPLHQQPFQASFETMEPRSIYSGVFLGPEGGMRREEAAKPVETSESVEAQYVANVGQEMVAKVVEGKTGGEVAEGRRSGSKPPTPVLPKAGKSYREAVVASSNTPPASVSSRHRPSNGSTTNTSSQDVSRKPSESADEVFESVGEMVEGGDADGRSSVRDNVFDEEMKPDLTDLQLTPEEVAFLSKGPLGHAPNFQTRNVTTSTQHQHEFQKITRRKGAKPASASETVPTGESAATRFHVLSKGGSPLRSPGPPVPPVRSVKLNNEDRAAGRKPTLNLAINNHLGDDKESGEDSGEEDEEEEDEEEERSERLDAGRKCNRKGGSGGGKRSLRDGSDGRRRQRRQNSGAEQVWKAVCSLLLTVAVYVEAAGRWLWDLVSDIGVQLWELSCAGCVGAWRAVGSGASRAWWRLAEAVRASGRAWREREWLRLFPAWMQRKKEEPGFGLDENIQLPTTGEEGMHRLLSCRGQDAYSILGLRADCSDEEIRRYYKRQAVLVHPDKNTAYGAEEAFKILAQSFELIETPEQRRKYDVENLHRTKAMQELNTLLETLRRKMEEARSTMQCDCGGKHRRFATKRSVGEARHCRRCKEFHPARENDIWAESQWLGFLWYYYACMEGTVYDITEWAACPRNLLKHMKPNAHLVQYRLITGKNGPPPPSGPGRDPSGSRRRGGVGGGTGTAGAGPGPSSSSSQRAPSEADVEALLSRFLDDRSGPPPSAPTSSSASYRPPSYPGADTGRPRKATRRRKK